MIISHVSQDIRTAENIKALTERKFPVDQRNVDGLLVKETLAQLARLKHLLDVAFLWTDT